jgi:hypothetical protein
MENTAGPDIITKKDGEDIPSRVIEIGELQIKYKKFSNLDGPIYSINKSDVLIIRYQNGEKDIFSDSKPAVENTKPAAEDPIANKSLEEKLRYLTKKGNKVYVDSENKNAIIHAVGYLKSWGYWKITEDINDADFILKIFIRFVVGEGFGYGQFVEPRTNLVLWMTQEFNSMAGFDLNSKRAVVRKIIVKGIKRYF